MKFVTTPDNMPFTPIQTYKILSVAVLLTLILFIGGFYLIEINHTTNAYPLLKRDAAMVFVISVSGMALFQFWVLPQFPLNTLILLLPGLAGMGTAFFLYALAHQTIEVMTLCCASLIMAVASNYGCIFILSRSYFDAAGRQETTRELRAIGVMIVILNGFAFGCLRFTDITVFKELSGLAAVSVAVAVLSVHTIFPKIPSLILPSPLNSPLYAMCERFRANGKRNAVIGAIFAIGMLFFFFQGLVSNPHQTALNFKLLAFVGFGLTGLIFFFFFDWKLCLLTVTPAFFAILNLAGLMRLTGYLSNRYASALLIIVMGTGIFFALFQIRSFQRYGGHSHPVSKITTLAIFIGFITITGGCAVFGLIHHLEIQRIGRFLSLGTLFNLIGIFLFLPTGLACLFRSAPRINRTAKPNHRVLMRYSLSEAYPRFFAGFKLRYDAMFHELPALLESSGTIRTIIDIGCGYGVPAAWLLERFPLATIYGIDPDRIRIRVASSVLGAGSVVTQNQAPAVPECAAPADIALMLDMIHFLNEVELKLTLQRLHRNLRPNGLLIVRTALPPQQRPSQIWRFENFKHRLFKASPHYRTADAIHRHIKQAGFKLKKEASSGSVGESAWFIAKSVS